MGYYKRITKKYLEKNDNVINYKEEKEHDGLLIQDYDDDNFIIKKLLNYSKVVFEAPVNSIIFCLEDKVKNYSRRVKPLEHLELSLHYDTLIPNNNRPIAGNIIFLGENIDTLAIRGLIKGINSIILMDSLINKIIVQRSIKIKKTFAVKGNEKILRRCNQPLFRNNNGYQHELIF